jgi:Ala-tRNA(Pro) deacylase
MPTGRALTDALDSRGIPYELLAHARTDRAADEAEALGVSPREVAKTIVLTTGDRNLRVVLPASERLDLHKVRDLLDTGKELHLLSEEELGRAYPEFELGAVPPIGGPDDDILVDRRIATAGDVVFEAGTHSSSVRMGASDLVSLAGERVADVCQD